mgnify:CR=1 FL=1
MPQSNDDLGRSAAQFLQTMSLLSWLINNPDGSLMQASNALQISIPQIRRELDELSVCGLPGYLPGSLVDVSTTKTSADVSFTAGLDGPLRLTSMETGVLLLNLESLRDSLPAGKHAAVDSLADKLHALMRKNREIADEARRSPQGARVPRPVGARKKSEELGSANQETSPQANAVELEDAAASQPSEQMTEFQTPESADVLTTLHDAIAQRRMVNVLYTSISQDATRWRRLIPDEIRVANGRQYLLARKKQHAPQRHFRLDRFVEFNVEEAGSAPRAQVSSIDGADPFNFSAAKEWAQLELSAQSKWMLEYFPMWVVDDVDPVAKDGVVVAMPDTGAWLERFLVANAAGISQIEPTEVAERTRRRAIAGISAYRGRFPEMRSSCAHVD